MKLRAFHILAWTAFALLNILYLVSCVQRTAIPGAVFDNIQSDVGLLASQVTRLGTIYSLIYGLSQFAAGMLVDRFGGKKMSIVGSALMGVGLVLFSMSQNAWVLYSSRIITAFGHSFVYLCIIKITHLLFHPKQFGALISITLAVGFVGSIIGTMPTQYLAHLTSWRNIFLVVGILSAVVAAAITIALSSLRERSRKTSVVTFKTVKTLVSNRGRLALCTVDFWAHPPLFVLQTMIGQKLIQDLLGKSAVEASMYTMVLSIVCIFVCLSSSSYLRLWGGRRKPVILTAKSMPAVSALLMIAVFVFNLPHFFFLIAFMLLAFNQIAGTASNALMSEITDTRTIAFTAAVRNSFPYLGSAVMGAIAGAIMDRNVLKEVEGVVYYTDAGYLKILALTLTFAVIGITFATQIPETRGKHIYQHPEE